MSIFSDNIKHLRSKKGISQDTVAESLSITRDILAKYEQGRSQAPYETLIKLSRFYHVSIDLLLTVDIRKVDVEGLIRLEDNRILLPIVVDAQGDNVIEVIPHKAKAGYLTGYSDPEYIENLQYISLPMLKGGKFRAFEVDGDSMPPHKNGSYIIGKYIESPRDMKVGRSYLIMALEGMTYKRLKKAGSESLLLSSDNEFYDPFEIPLSQVLQLWEFAGYFGTDEFTPDELTPQEIRSLLLGIRNDIKELAKA